MGFMDAVRTCLRDKYATFSGRASRSEFWWFVLFYFLVNLVVTLVLSFFGGSFLTTSGEDEFSFFAQSTGPAAIISILVFLALFLPAISVAVRRFHDVNLSGWWYFGCIVGSLIPLLGFLIMLIPLIIGMIKGTEGDNRFGPDPLAEQNPADVFA